MNKTIIININGTVFHIEEDAYEVLKAYMTNVKRHFMNSADSLEITTDIENRIAEMFSDALARESKQVIVEQDVNSIIEQMGRVEEFDEVYDDNQAGPNPFNYNTGERRLFRDPDDRIISGVCSGMASYFNIQPVWIRLAFALTFFFFGSGLLLYIILWIVIPQAVSRADRMAMRGHKQDLQGFKINLQEELSAVKGHFNNLHEEARPFVYKARDFVGDFADHLGRFFNGAGKVLVKLLGIIILIACFGAAIALIVSLVAFVGFGEASHNHLFPFSIVESHHARWIYISAFLTAFIPVITIILVVISAVFGTRSVGRSSATTLLAVWLCALVVFIYYAAGAAGDFKTGARFSETIKLKLSPDNVYHLKLNDAKYLTHDDSISLGINDRFHNIVIKNSDDDNDDPHNTITLDIVRSDDINSPELEEDFIARGADERNALMNARNVNYMFLQKDSVLQFDWRLSRKDDAAWHDENVDLTLKLPLNAKVTIDEDLNNRVSINNISVGDCKSLNKTENATSATFIMTNDGPQCKVDTVVVVKTPKQLDSARKSKDAETIAKYRAQIDSVKKADSLSNE
jgi:phage shock protein PspC (stress-responsive transcriptional regulator)